MKSHIESKRMVARPFPAIKGALAGSRINGRITLSGYEGSELLVARLLIECGADVRYVGTACGRTQWSDADRDWLRARIARRFDAMLAAGALDEARARHAGAGAHAVAEDLELVEVEPDNEAVEAVVADPAPPAGAVRSGVAAASHRPAPARIVPTGRSGRQERTVLVAGCRLRSGRAGSGLPTGNRPASSRPHGTSSCAARREGPQRRQAVQHL